MSSTFFKKVAIAGLSFGLIVSPLAMANFSIKANQDLTVDDEPIKAQSQRTSGQAEYSPHDLMYDVGDRPNVIKAESTGFTAQSDYKPKDLIRNGGSRNTQ